jgi:class 3 adenylate cyclase
MPEERRLVTILFADVVGSTALGEALDPEDLRRLLARFYEIAKTVVEAHAGTLEKFIGDAAMAIFGLPQAHDDDARRALDSALELIEQVQEDPMLGERLPIRMGVSTGEVVASRERDRGDFIVTGDAVNVAARLQQAADPWEILATGRTASAVAGAYELGPTRELDLKGKASSVVARRVIGRSDAKAPRAPLVGRDADLAQLELAGRRAFGERRPYLVSLIAPAGTGKSRLVEEFLSRLDGLAPGAKIATAQCLPYGQRLTYWPMRALLLDLLELGEQVTDPEQIRERLDAWLRETGAERPGEIAEILAATIGASDAEVTDRSTLFAAWRAALELAAAQRPLVLLVEDLHWSSDSLLDLVEFILQPRADAPMLMLALSRPELLERRPTWGGGRRNHVSLALEPLDEGSIETLVQNILDGPAPELATIVAARSEGNPFYAGEIVRSLVERGVDLRDPAAVTAAAESLPDTVQATVLARLDALDPVARNVVQLGSVFGRSFVRDGIAALDASLADDLDPAIERLVERELLRPAPGGQLVFRHILIRDGAYGTLPRAERAVRHAAAANWLVSGAAGREDELAELIAFHFREAVILGERSGEADPIARERAVSWLRRAADVAAGARGIAEALTHVRAALELAPLEQQPEIYRRIGELHGSGDRSVEAYASAWRLGSELGRPPDFLLDNLAQQLMVTCRWTASVADQPTEAQMNELIKIGRSWLPAASPRTRASFLIATSNLPFWLRNTATRTPTAEDLQDAKAAATEGMRIAEEIDDPILISAALDAMTSLFQSAEPAAALELSQRRVAMGARLSADERLDALNMVAWTSVLMGDLPRVLDSSATSMNQIQPGQNAGFAVGGASWHAYALALIGSWEPLVSTVDWLRARWIEAERPAASYGLQGPLSAVDWARNRRDEALLDRWEEVAREIVGRFQRDHPVAALGAILDLDLERVAELIGRHERYPDRVHYVEHALAICADRAHAVPLDVIDAIVDRGTSAGMRVLIAQALRLRGLLRGTDGDLEESLRTFREIGAGRYAARVQRELGGLRGDEAMRDEADGELDRLGELDELERLNGLA